MSAISKVLFEGASSAGASGWFDMTGFLRGTIYLVFGPGVSGGAVTVETALSPGYGGTWEPIATVTAEASTVKTVDLSRPFRTVRARISTAISGGTASAYAHAVRG